MTKHALPSGHKARKRFGQNFLINTAIIRQIVRAIGPTASDNIVEIGPGQGAITAPLLEHNPAINVIELDRDLVPVLLAQFVKYKDFKIHQADALSFDFGSLLRNEEDQLRVVGNLPYNISTPLIFHLLSARHQIRDMHFMLQKEVVLRLTAGPGDKNYGRLGIMAQYHCDVENMFDVPPDSFHPAPKVDSAIVRLCPHRELPIAALNYGNFERLVRTAFQQRRKTLRNGLKSLVSDEQAAKAGLDLSLRAENLSVQEYVKISNAVWGDKDFKMEAS